MALLSLANCTVSKVTVQGQYGEYSFTPRKAIVIEHAK
jgi:hypothetical protein